MQHKFPWHDGFRQAKKKNLPQEELPLAYCLLHFECIVLGSKVLVLDLSSNMAY